MKCPSDILKTFDFDKIVLKLCSLAVCPVTRELLARLEPAPTVEEANQRLTTVQQYQEMITFDGNIDFRGLSDLRTIYQKMSIAGSLLPGEEIIRFLDFLLLCERTRQFFLEKNLKNKYSLLQDLFLEIGHFEGWIKKINSIMAPDGQILDRASEKLFTIRKRIQQIHEKIRITIDATLRNRDLSPMMQDQTFTIRRGRYVIPIKSEFRHRVEGLVVDYSSSGSSVFIEPKSLLFLNNELEVLTIQEGEEIERILRHLTASLAPSLPDFEKAFQRLITLDSLQAKARLGQLWNADIPVIGGEELLIRKGRHPLLGERAVPFNLQLTPEKKIMIISGPNAGGKTVLLKSLALIVYLAICGVPVPVDRGSRIPFYQTLYIDIGDHQDIEQNLSTFSSRLLSLQSSLVQASKESLFLIDEIGAGTDPNEGSALGIGIISYLLEHGSTGVFTTHFPAIKQFTAQVAPLLTASMEFDPVQFVPTFRLLTGEIGESYGIKIAERIGLPASIIHTAQQHVNTDWFELNELIISHRRKNRELDLLLASWNEKVKTMEQQKEEMETLRQELEREKKGAGERFQKEGEHYWKKTREEIAQLIGQLRKEQSLNEDVYEHIKKRMKEKEEETDRLVHENNGSQTLEPPVILQGGEQVFVDFLNQNALVVEVDVNKKEAVISVKGRKIKTSVHHLKKLSPPPVVGDSGPFHRTDIRYSYQPTSSPVPNEIEIRMMKYEEAQEKLDKYLDQVLLAGYKTVYIIHGKGEGILRKMTQDSLRNNPAVESYRTGLPEEGGMGITVVTMR